MHIVPVAEALVEPQHYLAFARGYASWHDVPAQYGYQIENVAFAPSTQCNPEVDEAREFMQRVFGRSMVHKAHEADDASCRTTIWWTNLFIPEYYDAREEDFNRGSEYTFAQIVQKRAHASW